MDIFNKFGYTANLPEIYCNVINEMIKDLPDIISDIMIVEDVPLSTAINYKLSYVWKLQCKVTINGRSFEGLLCHLPRITPGGYFVVDGIEKFPMIHEIFMKSVYQLTNNVCTVRLLNCRRQIKIIFSDTQILFISDEHKIPVFNLLSSLNLTFVDITQIMHDMQFPSYIISTSKAFMLIGSSRMQENIPNRYDFFGDLDDKVVACILIYMTSIVIGESIGFYKHTDLSDYKNKTFRCYYDIIRDVFSRSIRINLTRNKSTDPKKVFISMRKELQHNMDKQVFQRFKTGISEIFGRRYESVVMTVSRRSQIDTISSVRKVMIPTDENTRNSEIRMIHPSQLGYVCPAETPEGRRVGLIRSLAVSCIISDSVNEKHIEKTIQSWNRDDEELHCYFVNGIPRFVHCNDLLKRLIDLKLKHYPFLSIYIESTKNIHVRTTRGRPMRYMKDGILLDPSENWGDIEPLHPSMMLGISASIIPLSQHNQCARTVFASSMIKQALEITSEPPMHVDHKRSLYAQKPIVTTDIMKYFDVNNGINVVVAIAPYIGWNEEDAIVLKKSFVERLGYVSVYVKIYDVSLRHDDIEIPLSTNSDERYNNGIITIGSTMKRGDTFITYARPSIGTSYEIISLDYTEEETIVIVDIVYYDNVKEKGIRFVTERYRKLQVGDKLSSRHAQKGVIGFIARDEDLPFSESGMIPDMVINPHAIPSRMTIGQLIESYLGKQCKFVNGTTFNHHEYEDGDEDMYHPFTGELISHTIVMGTVYYLVLPHQAIDKIHHRSYGELNTLSNQPLSGRSRGGGLRIGEMEIDCLISHGASELVKTVMRESDETTVFMCNSCGYFLSYNNECILCHQSADKVNIPYSLKTIANVLQMAGIKMELANF
jgi:DNA-directed RNA polymerase beta subunit